LKTIYFSSSEAYLIVAERTGTLDETISKKSVAEKQKQKNKKTKQDKNKVSIHATTAVGFTLCK